MEKTGYPSVDKPWNKYYSNSKITKEEVENRISKSMYQMYDESTKNIEDNITRIVDSFEEMKQDLLFLLLILWILLM